MRIFATSRAFGFAFTLALVMTIPAAAQQPASESDAKRLIGVWRLVTITEDGKVNPLRGAKPTGFIFYTASGHMGALIQPERGPVKMAGKTPTGEEALAALKGYTGYFGTYTVDEKTKIVTHHRTGNVQPGQEVDARRNYRFEAGERLILGGVGTTNEIVWERTK